MINILKCKRINRKNIISIHEIRGNIDKDCKIMEWKNTIYWIRYGYSNRMYFYIFKRFKTIDH